MMNAGSLSVTSGAPPTFIPVADYTVGDATGIYPIVGTTWVPVTLTYLPGPLIPPPPYAWFVMNTLEPQPAPETEPIVPPHRRAISLKGLPRA